ncbi:LytR/AlgR family response regulator transcription factor [Parasediminibacterium paludis]|uniref:LytR/AlgR family response regulator transcription factor n=1 Tax=Parasediminibacterium paludis TaxID=908966 RepID=A0ABV8PR86_9BACT
MADIKKVVLIDDEDDARLLIRQYMEDFPQLLIIKECNNGLDAVNTINSLEPDLIFLDIQMPGLSGFQVLQKIIHVPQIIFSTAFDNYALKAFDNNAVDYLLKPFTKQRFEQAVNKVLLNTTKNMDGIKNLSDNLQSNYTAYPEKVLVDSGNRMVSLPVNDIVWLEAEGDYTKLHTLQKSYLSSYGIGTLEQKLNPTIFTRIHRSAIININYVKEVFKDANGYYVVLQNNTNHKVGRNYLDAIKKLFV